MLFNFIERSSKINTKQFYFILQNRYKANKLQNYNLLLKTILSLSMYVSYLNEMIYHILN